METADLPEAFNYEECDVTEETEAEDETVLDDHADPHWETKSAVVSEPQLLQLLSGVPAACPGCGRDAPPRVARQSLSFRVTWVSDCLLPEDDLWGDK